MTTSASTPLRRLPITLTPVHRETVTSFLRRLATVNHIDHTELITLAVAGTLKEHSKLHARSHITVDVDHLARLTGHPAATLTRALPALADPSATLPANRVLRACPRCTHRHRGGPVMIHPLDHHHVCLTHHLWLGSLGPNSPTWPTDRGPIDISAVPTIVAAQRRHHRLIRHQGDTAHRAVNVAVDTWTRCFDRPHLWPRHCDRITVLRPNDTRFTTDQPVIHAVRYPEIITIAAVLASLHWQAIAAQPHAEHTLLAEISRRLAATDEDHDSWHFYTFHPPRQSLLRDWLDRIQGKTHDLDTMLKQLREPLERLRQQEPDPPRPSTGITYNETTTYEPSH